MHAQVQIEYACPSIDMSDMDSWCYASIVLLDMFVMAVVVAGNR